MAVILQKTLEGNNSRRLIEGCYSHSDEWGQRMDRQGAGDVVRSAQILKVKPVQSSGWLYVLGKKKKRGYL